MEEKEEVKVQTLNLNDYIEKIKQEENLSKTKMESEAVTNKAICMLLGDAFFAVKDGDSVFWQESSGVWVEKEIRMIISDVETRRCKLLLRGDAPSQVEVWEEDGDYIQMSDVQWIPFINKNFATTAQVIRSLWPKEKLLMFVPRS